MTIPSHPELSTNRLAGCFSNTSTPYKFYWFLSLLARVEKGELQIGKRNLFADMIAQCWYTVNYFHVSFGKQDKLQAAVETIKNQENLTVDASRPFIYQALTNSSAKATQRWLQYFNGEVPHRFLSPWFPAGDMKSAYAASKNFTNDCLYALHEDHIEMNPTWVNYLRANAGILKSFCYWHLTLYLQARNPNVPDIPNKLIRTSVRKSLAGQRKNFWDIVLNELGGVDCIYTNSRLHVGNYAVEHFIPYAFVAHDLMWNLIPANASFNSSKSDKLPVLDTYFEPFYKLQKVATDIVLQKQPTNKYLEEYLTIFPTLNIGFMEEHRLLEQMQPLVTIASNNGFQFLPVKH